MSGLHTTEDLAFLREKGFTETAEEIERLQRELEYAYRVINFGFTYGNFDFSILKEAAAKFVVNADVAAAKAA